MRRTKRSAPRWRGINSRTALSVSPMARFFPETLVVSGKTCLVPSGDLGGMSTVAGADGEGFDGDERGQILTLAMQEFYALGDEARWKVSAAEGADFHVAG